MQKQFKDSHFSNAETFLTTILNNYDFLLLYTDSIYLYEDFAKLPGGNNLLILDEAEEKKHLDIKRLMIMKQKGIKIDTQSERNIRKKWDGIDFKVFNIEDRKYAYKVASEEVPKEKEKKGGKKDSKDPKKEQVQEPENSLTKVIETFKTWRQKSVFTARNESYENYKKDYENDL